MIGFDYLLGETVTINGKKLDDNGGTPNDTTTGTNDNDQSGTTKSDTESKSSDASSQPQGFGQPATNSDTSIPSDSDSVQSAQQPDGNTTASGTNDTLNNNEPEDDATDYTSMKSDEDDQNQSTENTPTDQDDAEETDYTTMTPDDDASAGQGDTGKNPNTLDQSISNQSEAPPTPTGTSNTQSSDEVDYTNMNIDDAGGDSNVNQDSTDNTGQNSFNSPDTGNADPGISSDGDSNSDIPGGSGPDSNGAAEEPGTDYGELSPDNNDPNDPNAGGDNTSNSPDNQNDQTGTDQTDQTTGDGTDSQTNAIQQMRDIEAKLFSDLSPEQIQLKDNELKLQFINLYEDIEKTINRVNRIVKTDANEEVVAFVSKKLEDLKNLTNKSLIDTYGTVTYIQNLMNYNMLLASYSSIGNILIELSKKDKVNDNIEKDQLSTDTDVDDMISSTMDDTGA